MICFRFFPLESISHNWGRSDLARFEENSTSPLPPPSGVGPEVGVMVGMGVSVAGILVGRGVSDGGGTVGEGASVRVGAEVSVADGWSTTAGRAVAVLAGVAVFAGVELGWDFAISLAGIPESSSAPMPTAPITSSTASSANAIHKRFFFGWGRAGTGSTMIGGTAGAAFAGPVEPAGLLRGVPVSTLLETAIVAA